MKNVKESIVLDLDGVIADIDSSISKALSLRGILSDDKSYGEWLISNTQDEVALNIFNDPMFWVNMKPYTDAWYQVNYWFSSGYDVHIVTARRQPNAIEQTLPWLEKWNINSLVPAFSGFGKKINVIKKINPLFVVEDNPTEIKILEQSKIPCFLRKQWYNKDQWSNFNCIDTLFDIDL